MTTKILVFDTENATEQGKPNPKTDKLRIFGCYSYITKKKYYLTDLASIRKTITAHDIIVGFNNIQYDNHVLLNSGLHDLIFKNNYGDCKIKGKINIDLMQIFKNRAGAMKIKAGMLGDLLDRHSLDFISRLIGIVDDDSAKKELDYSILNKDSWTPEEFKEIISYTERDIDITTKMYEWLEKYFESFKDFVLPRDVENKTYLTCAISVFTYKAICKKLGVEEEYNDTKEGETYLGAYVSFPPGEHFSGKIYPFDFKSEYPHAFTQCALFSPTRVGYNGNGVFKLKGTYNDKELGPVEKVLIEFMQMRDHFKATKDPREYSVKIIINTAYGLTGNPKFKHLYNPIAAADCTALGRQWIKLARRLFKEAGYKVIYTDTDSVYVLDHLNDIEKITAVKNKIVKFIKDNVPFPQPTFDMGGLNEPITDMWFFKGKDESEKDTDMDDDDFINRALGLMKKNYIYLTEDKKVIIKNLGIRKKSNSKLSRKLFWDIIVPYIKEKRQVKFSKTFLMNQIVRLLNENINYASIRYKVHPAETYKKPTQIQAQIAKRYGAGIHFLIPNNKFGIGKDKMYCSIDEFKEHNLQLSNILLDNIWSELSYFIEQPKVINLNIFFGGKK